MRKASFYFGSRASQLFSIYLAAHTELGNLRSSPKHELQNPHEKMPVIVNVLTRLVDLSPLSAACEKPKTDSIPRQISSQGGFHPKTDFIPRQTSSQKRFCLKTDFIPGEISSQDTAAPQQLTYCCLCPLSLPTVPCPWKGWNWMDFKVFSILN